MNTAPQVHLRSGLPTLIKFCLKHQQVFENFWYRVEHSLQSPYAPCNEKSNVRNISKQGWTALYKGNMAKCYNVFSYDFIIRCSSFSLMFQENTFKSYVTVYCPASSFPTSLLYANINKLQIEKQCHLAGVHFPTSISHTTCILLPLGSSSCLLYPFMGHLRPIVSTYGNKHSSSGKLAFPQGVSVKSASNQVHFRERWGLGEGVQGMQLNL